MADLIVPPTFRSVPEYDFTSGPEVIDANREIGFGPDVNQADILNAIFAENHDGTPTCFEVCIVCARQNLKTAVMKMAAIGWLFVTNEMRIVYSAHEWNPACAEMYDGMKELIGRSPWMKRRVERFVEGKGEQAIELKSGASMMFKTRTADTMRALSADKLLLDEALKLLPTHMGSAVPTLSTRPQAQIVYGSSAGKATSEVLRDVRDRGRAAAGLVAA